MNSKIIIILLLFYSILGLSQSDSLTRRNIEIKSYLIDNQLGNRISKSKFEIDSIYVRTKRYVLKEEAKIKFNNSGLKLFAEFYYDQGKLILIRFTERNPEFKTIGTPKKTTTFYYVDEIFFDERIAIHYSGHFLSHLYNQNMTSDFLKKLANKIINKQT